MGKWFQLTQDDPEPTNLKSTSDLPYRGGDGMQLNMWIIGRKKGGITNNRKMGNDRRPLFPAKLPPIFWGMLCHWQQSKTCLRAAPEKLSHMGVAQYLWDYGTNCGILDPFVICHAHRAHIFPHHWLKSPTHQGAGGASQNALAGTSNSARSTW